MFSEPLCQGQFEISLPCPVLLTRSSYTHAVSLVAQRPCAHLDCGQSFPLCAYLAPCRPTSIPYSIPPRHRLACPRTVTVCGERTLSIDASHSSYNAPELSTCMETVGPRRGLKADKAHRAVGTGLCLVCGSGCGCGPSVSQLEAISTPLQAARMSAR